MAFQSNAFQTDAFYVQEAQVYQNRKAQGSGFNKILVEPRYVEEEIEDVAEELLEQERKIQLKRGRKAPELKLINFEPITTEIKLEPYERRATKKPRVQDDIEALIAIGAL